MILMEIILGVVIWVLVMEVNKVAGEVTDMEVEKVTDMQIPIEYLILAICDTYRDYVRSGPQVAKFSANTSGATWWTNFQLMELSPVVSTNTSGATPWPNFKLLKTVKKVKIVKEVKKVNEVKIVKKWK